MITWIGSTGTAYVYESEKGVHARLWHTGASWRLHCSYLQFYNFNLNARTKEAAKEEASSLLLLRANQMKRDLEEVIMDMEEK